MALRLNNRWVWDFWLTAEEDRHHIFYLQAPRSLVDPELRHRHATIGHAVSRDLTHWEVLADALGPGPQGSWDDLAVWTGSTVRHEGRWYLFYTGIGSAEAGLVQRIGLAVSDDGLRWTRHPSSPVMEADPRWYERLDLTRWRDLSWRDPFVFRDSDGLFHAFMAARSPFAPTDEAGVVGHARSVDLLDWEVLPPVTEPGEFAQVEVPQLADVDGGYALLISCHAVDHSQARRARLNGTGAGGTYMLSATAPLGPFAPAPPRPLAPADGLGSLYAAKLVQTGAGQRRLLAFRGGEDGEFVGELTDPMPVRSEGAQLTVITERRTDGHDPRLAPEIVALLDWGARITARHRGLSVAETRAQLVPEQDAYLRALGMRVAPVAAVADHEISVPGGSITVRVYTPEGRGSHPAFVHLHGGGFVLGTVDSLVNEAKCASICSRVRCVVATVEYRLSPEHPFPTAAEDGYAALRFVAEHATELEVDQARIAIGGESAGGDLAAALALMTRDRRGPPLVLQLLEVPVCDLRPAAADYPSVDEFRRGFGLDWADMELYTQAYLPRPQDAAEPLASPLAADDLSGVAPAHVMTAEYDVLRDSGEAFAARLRDAGVQVSLQRMLGHTHGSAVLWPCWEPARHWMHDAGDALRRAFAPGGQNGR